MGGCSYTLMDVETFFCDDRWVRCSYKLMDVDCSLHDDRWVGVHEHWWMPDFSFHDDRWVGALFLVHVKTVLLAVTVGWVGVGRVTSSMRALVASVLLLTGVGCASSRGQQTKNSARGQSSSPTNALFFLCVCHRQKLISVWIPRCLLQLLWSYQNCWQGCATAATSWSFFQCTRRVQPFETKQSQSDPSNCFFKSTTTHDRRVEPWKTRDPG